MGLLGKLFNNKKAVQDRLLLHRLGSMELVNYGTAQIKLEKVEWICKGPGEKSEYWSQKKQIKSMTVENRFVWQEKATEALRTFWLRILAIQMRN